MLTSKYFSYVLTVIPVPDSVRVRCGERGKTSEVTNKTNA